MESIPYDPAKRYRVPTIQDVARRAGVAPVTVSRVVNNSGYVSAETRTRVETAIASLGYVPNRLAGGLRTKRTHTLGLVLTDITNPFWTTVARGAEDAAQAQGYNVILCNTDESEYKQDQYVRVLLQKQVDGVLLVPARSTAASADYIQAHDVPVVVLDRQVPSSVDVVRCDSEGGAYGLVKHLIDLGHRRIAVLSGARGVSTARDRVTGYARALMEAGIQKDDHLVFYREFTQEAGYAMALEALAVQPSVTALFAVNNFIAIGALKALEGASLCVPDDISLVAFDDLPLTLVVNPILTVAAQPAYEMGQRATQQLVRRILGEAGDDPEHIVLPTRLIVRRSSGPPPAG